MKNTKKGTLQAKINNLLQVAYLTKDEKVIARINKEIAEIKLSIRRAN